MCLELPVRRNFFGKFHALRHEDDTYGTTFCSACLPSTLCRHDATNRAYKTNVEASTTGAVSTTWCTGTTAH